MTRQTGESKAAVEEAERWARGLEAVAERIKGRFPRSEPRERVVLQKFSDYTRCCAYGTFTAATNCGQNIFCNTTFQLSYRDVEEMMRERGLDVDHSTVFRWVQRYGPEINKRVRQHLKMSGTSYRVDETYIKVGKTYKYLYRAVDKQGSTIEFMLSAKRDVSVAKRFLKKMMRAEHRRLPFTISVDKNAAYPEAFATSQEERILPKDCKLRRVKYLNNVIEQDHRFIKKKVRASQCFKGFLTAERTLEGIEAVNMIRKGQVKRLDGRDSVGQAKFVASLFGIAA